MSELEHLSDDELFAELQNMDGVGSSAPLGPIHSELLIDDRRISAKRLESCTKCEFLDGLKCSKDNSTILVKIKIKNSVCPIGEW